MSESHQAFVIRDPEDWQRSTVRLVVRTRHDPNGRAAYLMDDGTWHSAEQGEYVGKAGIVLPADAIEAIANAIAEFQGHASHADTEARVLREWLASERDRVERLLFPVTSK